MSWLDNLRLYPDIDRTVDRPINMRVPAPPAGQSLRYMTESWANADKWTADKYDGIDCERCGEVFDSLGQWARHINPQVGPSPCPKPRVPMPKED